MLAFMDLKKDLNYRFHGFKNWWPSSVRYLPFQLCFSTASLSKNKVFSSSYLSSTFDILTTF